ncbi:hypothetical protein M3E10_01705 [Dietzia cinnamea]|nr:hypothetical protein [Dietzia cinnamea]MBM7229834.1 hypothetical protein [Dietzia cinnamea]MCT2105200.1 hypothetical protein [Dietzia cinnamea]MCT2108504.1 hypothetical protein [Dietzia cinnamea]
MLSIGGSAALAVVGAVLAGGGARTAALSPVAAAGGLPRVTPGSPASGRQ